MQEAKVLHPSGVETYRDVLRERLHETKSLVINQKVVGIAFAGAAGSGKTASANHLSDFHGFHRLSFATPLKEAVHNLFGPLPPVCRRKVLQLGGAALRQIWHRIFVFNMLKGILEAQLTKVVVDDLRMPEEGDALREAGFILVKNEAPRELCISRLQARDGAVDPSLFEDTTENSMKEYRFDRVLDQTRPFAEVARDLDNLVKELLNGPKGG